jgi:hypothetical protein
MAQTEKNMGELFLTAEECRNAGCIQLNIDLLAQSGGGVLNLPAGDFILDRGLRLYDNITINGKGENTILRKAPGKIYPLAGYHNYGMRDLPLSSTDGLEPGMTVWITDDRTGGFHETIATITWVKDGWVGIDQGIRNDLSANASPRVITQYPLIWADSAKNIKINNLTIEGNKAGDPFELGSCRGGAIYFINSANAEVNHVQVNDFAGEGISFQMCQSVRILNSNFTGNRGNGLHPGAGSTDVLFDNCVADNNERYGFFFCVRANHITVRNCKFRSNQMGMSLGARDCYNLIEDCIIENNINGGIGTRPDPIPIEVHSCIIRRCIIANNGNSPQIDLQGPIHDIAIENCEITGTGVAIHIDIEAKNIYLDNNTHNGHSPKIIAEMQSLTTDEQLFTCGCESTTADDLRHLL